MRQIRLGVFETNSSSTHSICIAKSRNVKLDYPANVTFKCRDFGWEVRKLITTEDKADYLYASILSLYSKQDAEKAKAKIMDMLFGNGINCEFELAEYSGNGWCLSANVDHAGGDDHRRFVKRTISNKGRLFRYLFARESYVLTGSDNVKCCIDIREKYPHESYYKGN